METTSSAVISPTSAALSHRRTRNALRLRLIASVITFGLGCVLFVGFMTVTNDVEQQNADLVKRGVSTTGIVEDIHGPQGGGTDLIQVAYEAGGHRFLRYVTVENDYQFHQHVQVFYDRHDPSRMTITGEENESGLSWIVRAALAVLGLAGLIWGGLSLVAWARCWRALRHDPWRPVHVELDVDGTRVVAEIFDGSVVYVCRGLRTALPPVMWMFWGRPEGDVLAVGPVGKRLYLADRRGASLAPFHVWRVEPRERVRLRPAD